MSTVIHSSGVEVRRMDTSRARERLFAVRHFAEGEAVLTELPVTSSQLAWNRACKYAACDLCMRPLETAEANAQRLTAKSQLRLPHPDCCATRVQEHIACPGCQAAYCSEACRSKAWQLYHQVICAVSNEPSRPLHNLLEAWKTMHYPPETTTIELAVRIMAAFVQSEDKVKALAVLERFALGGTTEEQGSILSRLLGEKWVERLRTLRELTAAIFRGHPCVTSWLTDEGFRSLMAFVAKSGQIIGTSALSVWVNNCNNLDLPDAERVSLDAFIDQVYEDIEKESGAFLNNEGVGLFPLQSLCSHSCIPNAESSFPHNNYVLSLVALRDIQPGEEITVSYLDECSLNRSRHSRAKLLRENHLLTCCCKRCCEEADQPDVTSDEEMDDESDEDNGT
ncbi:protein-lysine N-trimethyltransferase SMYD5-like isoform X2 [Dermacentor andersoni]|uniref:protein-lysine N-trimethyltransferase SMYD5-like isoform X2 n=1 Tax=Dermacentor andersoni TaxID=34620 RepID=UPI0021556718|nr:histone-lysine N-trimethyltransferase SMYD5-like isoform X2 [Dermacentor andersoni]